MNADTDNYVLRWEMSFFNRHHHSSQLCRVSAAAKSQLCGAPAACPWEIWGKKWSSHTILEKLKVVLPISWFKSLALFEATSWTIMCQNLGWYSKLSPQMIEDKLVFKPIGRIIFENLSKWCSMQENPSLSKWKWKAWMKTILGTFLARTSYTDPCVEVL